MEQEKINNEKEVLMNLIKERYCSNSKFHKWFGIISLVLGVIIVIFSLCAGSVLEESNTLFLFVFLWLSCFSALRFGKKLEPITDPRELLSAYDRYNRYSWAMFIFFFALYLLSLVFLKRYTSLLGILLFVVVIFGAFWLTGVFKDKNVTQLRELVNQENDEKVS